MTMLFFHAGRRLKEKQQNSQDDVGNPDDGMLPYDVWWAFLQHTG